LAQAFSVLALLIMCAAVMVVALFIGALAALPGPPRAGCSAWAWSPCSSSH